MFGKKNKIINNLVMAIKCEAVTAELESSLLEKAKKYISEGRLDKACNILDLVIIERNCAKDIKID